MLSVDHRRFTAEKDAAMKAVHEWLRDNAALIFVDSVETIADRTRVKTGAAVGSLNSSLDAPNQTKTGRLDPSRSAVKAEAASVAAAARPYQDIYCTGTADHLPLLESSDLMFYLTSGDMVRRYSQR